MYGLRTWVLQDVVQVISKRPLQCGSIACLHNSSPSGRFWSFFEFSKRDGQSLYKTKENESPENHGNFPGTILALPRPHILELPIAKKETQKDVSNLNLKLKDLQNNVKAIGDGSQKSKIENTILQSKELKVEEAPLDAKQTVNDANKNAVIQEVKVPILEMSEAKSGLPLPSGQKSTKSWYDRPPRPPSVAPKNCPPVPQRPEFNAKPKCPLTKPKKICPMNNSDQSKVSRKKYFSKSCSNLSKLSFDNKENNLQSSSMKIEKSASFSAKEKGKSSLSLRVSVEVPRLRTTKSLPDQIVSRYSSGVAESGLFNNSKKSGSKTGSWNQVANMGWGRKKKNKKEKKSQNNCQKNQECPPPCCPPPPPPCPPPPPPCCPPPPPPCCPEREVSSKPKKMSSCPPPCPPPPPPSCSPPASKCEKPKNMKKKKNKCDDWCPDIDPHKCYTSKCEKRKKMPPKPRICPPTCFEPDECNKPKSFCVDPKKKGSKGKKCFSTWAHRSSAMLFAYRSFASDSCQSKNKEDYEEKFNRRIPKPGPACKGAKSGSNCQSAAPVKKPEDKCKEPPKKSCEPSSNSGKQQQLSTENLVRREFEEVQKCKEGRKEMKSENKCKDETPASSKSDKKTTVPTGLERVISPCKLERMKKSECKNQEATCKMISVDDPFGLSYKNLLGIPQMLQSDFTDIQKTNNYLPIDLRSETSINGIKFEGSHKGKDLRGSFFAQSIIINDQIPRNKSWLTSWFH